MRVNLVFLVLFSRKKKKERNALTWNSICFLSFPFLFFIFDNFIHEMKNPQPILKRKGWLEWMKMRSPNASLRFTFVKQTHVRKQKKLNIFKIISRFYDSVFCEKREISWFILRLSNAPNEVIPLALSPRRLILGPRHHLWQAGSTCCAAGALTAFNH